MTPPTVFVVHGRDATAYEELMKWLKGQKALVQAQSFETQSVSGRAISEQLEQMLLQADAAIILATPDDLGALAKTPTTTKGLTGVLGARARQNVWLELGWCWGRLGFDRTLVLIKGSLDIPSDYDRLFVKYTTKISEASKKLREFLRSLHNASDGNVVEVLRASSSHTSRDADFHAVARTAQERLIITGTAMTNLADTLAERFEWMLTDRPSLQIDFVQLAPKLLAEYEKVLGFGSPLEDDGTPRFKRSLETLIRQPRYKSLRSRIRYWNYDHPMFFQAVVADPDSGWGGLMGVETLIPYEGHNVVDRPRFLLRRRVEGGIHDRYRRGVAAMLAHSTRIALSFK